MRTTIYRQTLTFDRSHASLDVHALHQLVMSGYFHALDGGHDDARARLNSLFLAKRPAPDTRGGHYPPPARRTTRVLVQANTVGDWSATDPTLGASASDPIAVDTAVETGDRVEVQVLANPTKSLPPRTRDDGKRLKRGKRIVLTGENDIAQWFAETMGKKGLALDPHETRVGAVERLQGARPKGGERSALAVDVRLLRGSGIITDPGAFETVLVDGIGRGRPYGAGLVRHRRVA